MKDYEFSILTNEKDIIEYEKKMYSVYQKKNPDSWVLKHGEIIDNCRLRPKIEYDKLIIYQGKYKGELFAGVKANFDHLNFQFERMGFVIPKEDKNKKICEGINYFILDNISDQNLIFNLSERFSIDFLKNIKEKGFQIKFGTCLKKIKIIYLRMGYNFIDQKEINNNTQIFIKFDFERTNIRET